MLRNTPIWYFTENLSGDKIVKIPAVFLRDDETEAVIEILENSHGVCSGIETVDIRDCAIREV